VVVVGDVNSTLACALVASKLGIQVAHVEAGLRSFDRTMPEEINRVLTDALADLLFVTEPSGVENLLREGADKNRIHLVGNVMVDTLLANRSRAEESTILADLELSPRGYVVVTLHRPSNVDRVESLAGILDALEEISEDLPIVFPVHPRTWKNLDFFAPGGRLASNRRLRLIEPLGYLDFLKLTAHAAVVLTDSGGIQEETTILGVPCLTLRENTERPITLTQGTNRLTGGRRDAIMKAYREVRKKPPKPKAPELWDGRTAERIVERLTGRRVMDCGSRRESVWARP
jgi:UDP-N-acetylglucosamine 2-epimerase (non-hydrolysing)